jgi:putative transposase
VDLGRRGSCRTACICIWEGEAPAEPLHMEKLPDRAHPQHGIEFFPNNPTILFDTVCISPRGHFLNNQAAHECLIEIWKAADHWKVGRYVIMPDHIHYFVLDCNSLTKFENWVRYWKSQFTKIYTPTNFRWQSDHWDYRIRSSRQYDDKFNYMLENPKRAGLVKEISDWPYQGMIYDFRWD